MNWKITIAMCMSFAAAGCSPLAPQQDHSKFFILAPISDTTSASIRPVSTSKSSRPLKIGVGPVDFPDYLRRLEVVTRTSPNQLDLSPEKRWGEPLDKNFERALSENLAHLLNTQHIQKYPWARRTEIDYQISIDVVRFESSSDGQSQLVARWIIKDSTGEDLYASETNSSIAVPAGEAGASSALSSDLAALSRDIATQIQNLDQRRASSTD
jgi:uncharacterized lipoprotein YmbA